MNRSFLLQIGPPVFRVSVVALAVAFASSTASAQIGNIGGGNAGGGGGAATTQGSQQAGNTTESLGGRTTQGIGAAAGQGNQFTGGSIADLFVGGAADGLFAGGGITTDRNSNRQFQALNSTSVPTGGTRNTGGTPRSVRTRLRVAFAVPATRSAPRPVGSSWPSMQQVASYRSDLQGVQVAIDAQGVATLTGMVADESSRRLAANLLRLRPGVRRLNNQLVVQQTPLQPLLPVR